MNNYFFRGKKHSFHIRTRDFYQYAVIFLLLFLGSSYEAVVSDRIPGVVRIFGLLVSIVIAFFAIGKYQFDESSTVAFLLITSLMSISFLLHQDKLYNFAILFLGGVLSGYLFTSLVTFDTFMKRYINIVVTISAISLLFFSIGLIFPNFLSIFPTVGNKFGNDIKSVLVYVWVQNSRIPQNYGMFWEPGAYQTFLSFALILELFFLKNGISRKSIILIITILTTLSTTGYFCLAFILIAYQINKNVSSSAIRKRDKLLALITFSAVVFIFVLPEDYYGQVFSKLDGIFDPNAVLAHSAITRINAIIYPFKAFLTSPIIGVGYKEFLILNSEQLDNNATFTILNWYALYGFFFGTIIVIGYFSILRHCPCPSVIKFIISIVLILIVISESYYTNPFIFAIVFFGYARGRTNAQDPVYSRNVQTAIVGKRHLC